jgi:histidine ammonia-lyase
LDLRVRMVEGDAWPGRAVAAAHAAIRARIAFLAHDRALDGDVRTALALVDDGAVLAAARAVVP